MWRLLALVLLASCVFCGPVDFVGEDIPADSDDGQVESTVNLDAGGPPVVDLPEPPVQGDMLEPPPVQEGMLEPPPVQEGDTAQGPPTVKENAREPPVTTVVVPDTSDTPDTGYAPGADIGGGMENIPRNEADTDQEPPYAFINGDGEFNCFQAREPMDVWYQGCTVKEVAPLCFDIKCPDNYQECEARDGTRHKMGDPEWLEQDDRYTCSCVDPGAVYWSLPRPPIGAPSFSPTKTCYLLGCQNRYNGEFMRPGAEFNSENEQCRCIKGQDPNLMDASTLYYLRCELSVGPLADPEVQANNSSLAVEV